MPQWIVAFPGDGISARIARIGAAALLAQIIAVCLLPPPGFAPVAAVFTFLTLIMCATAVIAATRGGGTGTASGGHGAGSASARFSPWFDLPLAAYAAAVALSSWLAPPGGSPDAWIEALGFSILAMATWRIALELRVRSSAVACLLASLAVLLLTALGPRSNPDPFGRFLYYPALSHWGAYPEVGLLACIAVAASIAMALTVRLWRLRIAAALLAGLFALVPLLVISRGAIVAIVVICAWLVLVAAIKWRERLVVAAFVIGCLGAGAIAWRYLDFAQLRSEYGQTAAAYAVGERASSWIAGRDMVRDHPLVGVGPGRYVVEFSKYRQDVAPMRHAHNMLLNVGAETGLLALVPFTLLWARMLLAPLWTRGAGHAAMVAFAAYGMIAAFFIRNLTDHFLSNVHSSLRSSLLVAILLGLAEASIRGSAADRRQLSRHPDS
jgi:O-antigen ligase